MNNQPNDLAVIVAATEPYAQSSGPNEVHPGSGYVPQADRRQYLDAALAGVELGTYDERILAWLVGWDDYTCRLIVSLIVRARRASYAEAAEADPLEGWRLVMQQALRDAIRHCGQEAGCWPADQIGLYQALARHLGLGEVAE